MQSETNRKHLREQLKNDVRRVEESLSKKLQRLQKLYTNDKSSSIERGYNGFLFQQKLEDMFKEEEKFTLSLTKYTREQFSGGITDLASCADKSKYKLLDTSKPDTFLFEGESHRILMSVPIFENELIFSNLSAWKQIFQ